MGIQERYQREQAKVAEACRQAGRDPEEVLLLAVSKTVDIEGAQEAFAAGARAFGENRPDELVCKSVAMPDAQWHFIGNIQSRRIPEIVAHADLIHSLYQLKHARKIDEVAAELGKVQDVLIEVNVSGEATKSGVSPHDAPALLEGISALPHLSVRGLMTMAPQGDAMVARHVFDQLARTADQLRAQLPDAKAQAFNQLSAGMSEDWEEAIAAGSTIVRIGRAIFSEEFE